MVQHVAKVGTVEFKTLTDADQPDILPGQRLVAIPTFLDSLEFLARLPPHVLSDASPRPGRGIFATLPADMDEVVGDVLLFLEMEGRLRLSMDRVNGYYLKTGFTK
jgi:hypothetical protein